MRRPAVHLSDLIPDLVAAHADAARVGSIMTTGLSSDSRSLAKGNLFFAIAGNSGDGRSHARAAASAGAAAIVTDSRKLEGDLVALADDLPILTCNDPRAVLANSAAKFWPRQPGMIAAVTGTNGKTSTAEFLRQIWARATWGAASIGTLGLQGADPRKMEGSMLGLPELTTPDAVSLHSALQPLTAAGVTHLSIEASSHGLEQRRLDGLKVSVAGFTNLTRDHLDHHADMEAYFSAKSRLFTELLMVGGTAVINIDDPYGARLADHLRSQPDNQQVILTVGQNKSADFHIKAISPMEFGLEIEVRRGDRGFQIPVALAGAFQAVNAVTAAVMAHASGLALHDSLGALPYVTGAEGRMQLVPGHPNGARIIVDYAHTPDALDAALSALRPEASGRLAVLFGAGGDRDPGKREMMGAVAHQKADLVFVTDDNPRTEDPALIRSAIMAGCPKAIEIADRAEAISAAMAEIACGDVLLIAGKGHESFQLVGSETLPFSDASVARNAIQSLSTADLNTKGEGSAQ